MTSYSISEIKTLLNGELIGHTSHDIKGPEELKKANTNHITFITSSKYAKLWSGSNACAALVHQDSEIEPGDNRAFIKVKNVELAMKRIDVPRKNLFSKTAQKL